MPQTKMDPYAELLDATIAHLEVLKRKGIRFVSASPELLRSSAAHQSNPANAGTAVPIGHSQISRSSPPPNSNARVVAEIETSRPPLSPPAKKIPAEPIAISTDHGEAAAMQELRERALVCQKCPNLASSRKKVVFGVGSIDAELMFV